jgi:hypothetical protein
VVGWQDKMNGLCRRLNQPRPRVELVLRVLTQKTKTAATIKGGGEDGINCVSNPIHISLTVLLVSSKSAMHRLRSRALCMTCS